MIQIQPTATAVCIDVPTAADLLGISPCTVRRMVGRGVFTNHGSAGRFLLAHDEVMAQLPEDHPARASQPSAAATALLNAAGNAALTAARNEALATMEEVRKANAAADALDIEEQDIEEQDIEEVKTNKPTPGEQGSLFFPGVVVQRIADLERQVAHLTARLQHIERERAPGHSLPSGPGDIPDGWMTLTQIGEHIDALVSGGLDLRGGHPGVKVAAGLSTILARIPARSGDRSGKPILGRSIKREWMNDAGHRCIQWYYRTDTVGAALLASLPAYYRNRIAPVQDTRSRLDRFEAACREAQVSTVEAWTSLLEAARTAYLSIKPTPDLCEAVAAFNRKSDQPQPQSNRG
jgi:hypothetical protein